MDDLISRQAAIDALETIGYDFSDSELSEIELEEVCEAVGDVRQDMINIIKRLPSAQPMQDFGRDTNVPSTDCISRQAVIDLLKQMRKDGDMVPWEGKNVFARIRGLPSAQPDLSSYSDKLWKAAYERGKAEAQPQRMRGRWSGPFCSKCGISKYNFVKILHTDDGPCGKWNYCPNCGAQMDGGEQDE